MIKYIKESGLYDNINEVRCVFTGKVKKIPGFLKKDKIKIVKKTDNISLYERNTLNKLWDDAQNEEFYVLYLHTKGVTRKDNEFPGVKDWVNYMLYFNCYKYKKIIRYLKEYKVVGVELSKNPIHFSGNFWWSKSSHIRTLERKIKGNRKGPESWITKNEYIEGVRINKKKKIKGKWISRLSVSNTFLSLFQSSASNKRVINLYRDKFPKDIYINKGITLYTNTFNGKIIKKEL